MLKGNTLKHKYTMKKRQCLESTKKKKKGLVVSSKLNKGLQCDTAHWGKQTNVILASICKGIPFKVKQWNSIRGDKAFENRL